MRENIVLRHFYDLIYLQIGTFMVYKIERVKYRSWNTFLCEGDLVCLLIQMYIVQNNERLA